MTFLQSIKLYGSVETFNDFQAENPKEKIGRPEHYAAKITTMFLPFLKENISENKFSALQEKLKSVVMECMEKTNDRK